MDTNNLIFIFINLYFKDYSIQMFEMFINNWISSLEFTVLIMNSPSSCSAGFPSIEIMNLHLSIAPSNLYEIDNSSTMEP